MILFLCEITDLEKKRIVEELPNHNIIFADNCDDNRNNIREANIIVSWKLSKEEIQEAEKLEYVQIWGAGKDKVDISELKRRNIPFDTTVEAVKRPIAEYVLGMVLYWERQLALCIQMGLCGNWTWEQRSTLLAKELSEINIGVVGSGNIGTEVYEFCKYLNMNSQYISTSQTISSVVLEELKYLDYVTIHLPLNEGTSGLIDEYFMNRLSKRCVLINTSRGEILDENALLHNLKKRKLRGASLDVTSIEPLPANNQFEKLDNIVITPHIAGRSSKALFLHTDIIIKNIKQWEGIPNEKN